MSTQRVVIVGGGFVGLSAAYTLKKRGITPSCWRRWIVWAGSFSDALAAACSDSIRVSTPVRRIVVADGAVTGVVTAGETIEADAVICAVPATKVGDLIPDLPAETRRALGTVSYSTGCRVVSG